jgi:type VI protein secretion system component Hcp
MSNNILVTISDFRGKGRPLKLNAESLTFGDLPVGGSHGGEGGGGKSLPKDVFMTMKANEHTPLLAQAAVSGTSFDEIKCTFCKLDKGVQVPFMTYELSDCMLTSVQFSGTGDNLAVTIGINFAKADLRSSE